MLKINPKVDQFIGSLTQWQAEIEALRMMLLDGQLTEELKWGVPCYVFEKGNIALIHGFKEYCAIGFFKGVLMQDPHGVLSKPGENTQSSRMLRFTNITEIMEMEPIIKEYIYEAVEIEKAGLKVEYNRDISQIKPEELQQKMDEMPEFKAAFQALTPGRQRAYMMYFSDSKQSKTREARIEKYTARILNGKGMLDCICGLSQKMPTCDGSHKLLSK